MAQRHSNGEYQHGPPDRPVPAGEQSTAAACGDGIADSIESNPIGDSEIQQIVASLDPNDGYRVRTHDSATGPLASLWLEICFAEQVQTEHSLKLWEGPTSWISIGERSRFEAVMSAVARYLNCGGDLGKLIDMLKYVEEQNLPRIEWPAAVHLLSTDQSVDTVQHIFIEYGPNNVPLPSVLVWTEGEFVDVQTIKDLAEFFESEDEVDEPDADA